MLLQRIGPQNSTTPFSISCPEIVRNLANGGVHRVNAFTISDGSGHSLLKDVGAMDAAADDCIDLALKDEMTDGGRFEGRWFDAEIVAGCFANLLFFKVCIAVGGLSETLQSLLELEESEDDDADDDDDGEDVEDM